MSIFRRLFTSLFSHSKHSFRKVGAVAVLMFAGVCVNAATYVYTSSVWSVYNGAESTTSAICADTGNFGTTTFSNINDANSDDRVIINSDYTVSGTVTVKTGVTLEVIGADVTFEGSAFNKSLNNSGTVNIYSGTLKLSRGFTNNSTGTINVYGGTFYAAKEGALGASYTSTNEGTIKISAGATFQNDDVVNNNSTGTINNNGTWTSNADVSNGGTVSGNAPSGSGSYTGTEVVTNYKWSTTATDTDWTNTANWEGGAVPGVGKNVVIQKQTSGSNYPVLSSTDYSIEGNALGDITIDAGATLTLKENVYSSSIKNAGSLVIVDGSIAYVTATGDAYSGAGNIQGIGGIPSVRATNGNIVVDGTVSIEAILQFIAEKGSVTFNNTISGPGNFETSSPTVVFNETVNLGTGSITPWGDFDSTITFKKDATFSTFTIPVKHTVIVSSGVTMSGTKIVNAGTLTCNDTCIIDAEITNNTGTINTSFVRTGFTKSVDASTGTFNVRGAVLFFNSSSTAAVWKTSSDQVFKDLYLVGNVELKLNGDCTADNLYMKDPSDGTYYLSDSFTAVIDGSGSITAGSMDITRCSSTDGKTGTLQIDGTVTVSGDYMTHSGTITQVNGTLNCNSFTHSAASTTPVAKINVDGTLNVTDLMNMSNNTYGSKLTVGSGGTVTAKGISYSKAYSNADDTVPVVNNGTIEVGASGFIAAAANKVIENNGTIKSTSGKISAYQIKDSAGDGSKGVIQFVGASAGELATTNASVQKQIYVENGSVDFNTAMTVAGSFQADTLMGGKKISILTGAITLNNGATLALAGENSSSLLTIDGNSGKGFIFAENKTGGNYLRIATNPVITDASGTVNAFHYTATASVPSATPAGPGDTYTMAQIGAVVKNGWYISDPKDLVYTWTGASTTDWSTAANWDTGIVPVEDAKIVIPSVTRLPVVGDVAVNGGSLSIETDAKVTLKTGDIVLSGKEGSAGTAAASTLTNQGSIVYTGDGRIKNSGAVINDDTQGTVEYGTSGTNYSGTISDVTYANLKVTGNTWSASENVSAASITVSGGQLDVAADKKAESDLITISGGTFSGVYSTNTSSGIISVTGTCSASGDFTFVTDIISIEKAVNATGYKATIYPKTNTTQLILGTTGTGLLISDTELDYITASSITLGNSSNTAGISIASAISSNCTVSLVTGGAITGTDGSSIGSAGDLNFEAASGIGKISSSSPVTLGSITGKVNAEIKTSGDIYLKTTSTATMNLGGSTSKVVLTPNGNIKIETAGNIVIGGDISATGGSLAFVTTGGAITRTAGTLKSSSTITLSANGAIGSTAGIIDVAGASIKAASTTGAVFIGQNGTLKTLAADDIKSGTGKAVYLAATAFDLYAKSVADGTGAVTLTPYTNTGSCIIDSDVVAGITANTNRTLLIGNYQQSGNITLKGTLDCSGFKGVTIQTQSLTSDSTSAAVLGTGSKVTVVPVKLVSETAGKVDMNGKFTFDELTLSGTGSANFTAGSANVLTVNNKISVSGTGSSNKLNLRSLTDGSQWYINCAFTQTSDNPSFKWVDVKDSYNDSSYTLVAKESTDSGNNDNWSFPGQNYTWNGSDSTSPTKWNVKANWSPASVPCVDGNVTIPAGLTNYPVIDSTSVNASNLITLGTGTLTIGYDSTKTPAQAKLDFDSYGFTAKTITNNGLVRMSGGNVITVNGNVVSTGSTTAPVNEANSTVEYYGDCGLASLPWGKSYANLEFTSGAKAELPSTYAITVSGTTLIKTGTGNDVKLPGTNTFTGGVTIDGAGDVIINAASSVTIADGAVCDSLAVKCAAVLTSVTTTGTQEYNGTVTSTGDAVFVTTDSTVTFGSNVTAASVTVTGKTKLTAASPEVKTTGAQEYSDTVTATGNIKFTTSDSSVTFASDVTAASIVVTGSTDFTKLTEQKVTTKGVQSYSGDINFTSKLSLKAYNEDPNGDGDTSDAVYNTVTFGGDVTGPADLTVDGTVTAATSNHVIDLRSASSYSTGNFNQGFTSGANITLKGNFNIAKNNTFTQFIVDNSELEDNTTVTFDGDSIQKINNAAGSTEYFKGYSETYPLLITGGDADHNWKVVFANKPTADNFSFVKVENSISVNSAGTANRLNIFPDTAHVQDTDNSDYTTTNWFTNDFYWIGGTDTNWLTTANWSYKEDGSVAALSYPDYDSGISEIKVADKQTVLTLSSAETGDINIKTLSVAADKEINLADCNVTLTAAVPAITNNGLIRLKGSQTVKENSVTDCAGLTVTSMVNGTDSTVEYSGDCGTDRLALGYKYNKLEFADGAVASVSTHAVTVAGTTLIENGTGNHLSLAAANTFTGDVTVTGGGNVVLNAVTAGFTLTDRATCDGLTVKSAVKLGSVETSAVITGTTEAETQVYEGAVTLSESAVFTGPADKLILFKSNVNCDAHDLEAVDSNLKISGNVTNGGNVTAGAAAVFGGSVTAASVEVTGTTDFTAANQTVKTTGTQNYKDNVTVTGNLSIKATDDVTFEKAVDSQAAGNGLISAEVINKSLTVAGKIGSTKELKALSVTAGKIVLNGFNISGNVTLNAAKGTENPETHVYLYSFDDTANYIELNCADYKSTGLQNMKAAGGVRVLAGSDGQWTASEIKLDAATTDLFVDAASNTLNVTANISAANAYIYNGTFGLASTKKLSAGNVAVFGANYSETDPRYNGTNTRFAYFAYTSLIYKPLSKGAALSVNGAEIAATGNFYLNGADISGAKITVPANDKSNPVFNSTAVVTEKQWGVPYAVAFNSTVTGVTVTNSTSGSAWLSAGADDGDTGSDVATHGCTNGGSNTNVQFNVPHIDQAYSVYDDVIYVHFDMPVENSNNEIQTNIALSSNADKTKGGVWYSDGTYNFSGAYKDKECTIPVTQTHGDLQEFYLRAKSTTTVISEEESVTTYTTWNTDATGLLSSADNSSVTDVVSATDNADSTDRSGVHKDVKTDITFLAGLFTAADGHTMSRNYGVGKEDITPAKAYTATGDKCAPVLVAVYTGQELHDQYVQANGASSQKEYDAHNFIEFRYSESVNIGDLSYDNGDVNARGDNSETHGGNIPDSDSVIDVKGFGSMSGSLKTGIHPDCTAGSANALYRKFSAKAGSDSEVMTHRVRVSIAGWVEGTVTYTDPVYSGESGVFHRWAGYINKSSTPQGTVTRASNSLITDIAGNELVSASAVNHSLPEITVNGYSDTRISDANSLYGNWDTVAPEVAPFSTSREDWNSWYEDGETETSEIIGSTTGSFLDHVEIHFFDNGRTNPAKWPAQWWRTKLGWNGLTAAPSLPDTAGGARPFTENTASTTGGIRRSSLIGANGSFTYKSIIDGEESGETDFEDSASAGIRQKMNGSIFRNATNPDTTNDGLFAAFPIKASENLAVRTTFVVTYNPANDYITDLAGNRLASNYSGKTSFNSVDLTPPAYILTLSPVAEDKIYVIFSKRLAYSDGAGSQEYLDELSPSELEIALEEIRESFIVCTAQTASSQIGVTKAEFVSFSKEYTALLLTLERKVTLSDIKTMWLRNTGISGGTVTVVDVSGFTIADTKIRDYVGNYLAQNKSHALSDFAVNAADVIYAFANQKNDDDWSEKGIYGQGIAKESGDYAVHDFTRTQGNYGRLTSGRDITLQVRTIEGVDASGNNIAPSDSFLLMPSKATGISSDMVSDKINKLIKSDWRLWLPTALKSLASSPNTNLLSCPASPVSADEDAGILWNYSFPAEDYNFKGGDEIQFVFKVQNGGADVLIDHDADDDPIIGVTSPTDRVPLYAVKMPEAKIRAGDFSFIDLWSFGIKDLKKQRGGVTILNNVINVNVKEQTVVEVDQKEDGNLSVYVLTLDGNVIKRLAHGRSTAGTHYFRWNGTNNAGHGVARGMYFIRVSGPGIDETRKVMCVKD